MQYMLNKAETSLADALPMPDFQERWTNNWIPSVEKSQRSVIDENLEMYVLETRSLQLADKMYYTSSEDRERNIQTLCAIYDTDCNLDSLHVRVKLFSLGNSKRAPQILTPVMNP